ncbi:MULTISPECIES: 16S rRNA (cytosine(1402)-N(4))-methyltransferase RsmH [Caproicibacterium]|uniref:Ribosomal RNA small subunit methyltransferase H n=1 Tax=Caproicibacterium argilliputei TaxID=3030016 RepID=A0AA97H0K1_9FIRM|nr:16S rRNA (cytosine(1402)-N(4))-methyltransferase RsmH [Caproicibacterium argilliputei]WOC31513.1 16S rRNA (cytosine(1402)-N(4))-methyltransferase RsmH [Caproicibacterium argilliputei]
MEFQHIPVLFHETIESLAIVPDGRYIDGTAGGGGHSQAILDGLTGSGRLLSIDQDPDAVAVCRARFAGNPHSLVRRGNFSNLLELARSEDLLPVNGVLLDIGVSSHQLDDPERGFSFHQDAPLDMRMSQEGSSAKDLVNTLSWQELADILRKYGEERFAARIAQGIVRARAEAPVETTGQLAEIVKANVPAAVRRKPGHPARQTFQALRIAVNGELDALQAGLAAAFDALAPGGRLCVITFHSLEDRIVKHQMAQWCQGCTCPPDFPVCVCGKKPRASLLYHKGLAPSAEELERNPRSRSARLRVCTKL